MGEQIAWSIAKVFMRLTLGVLFGIGFMQMIAWYNHPRPKADNPEEWQAISTDKNVPDTIIAYREGNTIHYQFKTNK